MTSASTPTSLTTLDSPIGPLTLHARDGVLSGVQMQDQRHMAAPSPDWIHDDRPFVEAVAQLEQYFAGTRTEFDLEFRVDGTPFQNRVWQQLQRIPYGETITYGELAHRMGNVNASRAVGLANGRNPLAVVVPCHRVIGADGSLTGYGGGLDRKAWLLAHEAGRHVGDTGSLRAGRSASFATVPRLATIEGHLRSETVDGRSPVRYRTER